MTDYTPDFERAFPCLVDAEGGYVNDPSDPGGETKYGISKAAYPHVDIKSLTLADAKVMYWVIWTQAHCDNFAWPVNYALWDGVVNSGQGTAVRWLQAAMGAAVDGVIGPQTLTLGARASQVAPQATVIFMLAERVLYLASLSTWRNYGRGWARRVIGIPFKAA